MVPTYTNWLQKKVKPVPTEMCVILFERVKPQGCMMGLMFTEPVSEGFVPSHHGLCRPFIWNNRVHFKPSQLVPGNLASPPSLIAVREIYESLELSTTPSNGWALHGGMGEAEHREGDWRTV
jgi:hypothetical protein